jgi:glucan phosphoethanolaminetransferase (alkaline phosphatase superfamily)
MGDIHQEVKKDQREYFLVYLTCFGLLMGGCVIAYVLGVASNNDNCFIVTLVLFFASLLLTVAWARTSKAARWVLACLIGLVLLAGVQYLRFQHVRHSMEKAYGESGLKH